MRKNGWDFREATKEYLGEIAEEVHTKGFETLETEKRTVWQRMKAKIQDFLNRILEGMKIPARIRLTENDLSYMMWKLYKHKERKAAGKPAEGDIFDKAEEIARREQWEREGESLEIAAREGGDNKTMAERAREVMKQEAIEIAPHDYSKEELKRLYSTLPSVEKDGRMIEFYHSAFGKNYRPDGTFAKIIPSLDAILESSKFAYSEMERGGGEVRRDGSTHKRHSDIVSRDNYVGKALIQGEEYFVRFNVQNKKKESGVHSTMVTSVDVYENTSTTEAIPTIHGGNLDYRGITDAKLREFFESAKKYPDYVKDLLPSDVENANTEYRVRENPSRSFDPEAGLHFRDGDEESGGKQDMTIEERTLKLAVMLADRHSGDVAVRDAAVEALGKTLGNIRKAMAAQHTYDFNTVRSLGAVADILISSGTFLPEGPGEVKRLYGIMKRGIGHAYTDAAGVEHVAQSEKDYNAAVESLMDLFVSNQLKLSGKFLDEVMKIRGSKVNARGVEVMGDLDVEGQIMVRGMKGYMNMDVQAIHDRIEALDEIIANGNEAASMNAAAEKMGVELAGQYVAEVSDRIAQEKVMRDQLHDMSSQWDPSMSGDARKAYTEQKRALRESIRKIRIERADAMRQLASQVGNELRNSIERVKAFREREKQRIEEIWHNANSDMTGRAFDEHGMKKKGLGVKLSNNMVSRLLLAPAATFEQVMRVFGSKSVDGRGYIFERFVVGMQKSRDNEWNDLQRVEGILNDKAAKTLSKREPTGLTSILLHERQQEQSDGLIDGGEMREHTLTQGNLMYIYMADKMTDGRVKLRAMGIDSEKITEVTASLDPTLREIADWIQEEFLPAFRDEINEVHMRMFGAPMAEIESYFPLKILGNAREETEDMSRYVDGDELPKTMTGALIKRRFNIYDKLFLALLQLFARIRV